MAMIDKTASELRAELLRWTDTADTIREMATYFGEDATLADIQERITEIIADIDGDLERSNEIDRDLDAVVSAMIAEVSTERGSVSK